MLSFETALSGVTQGLAYVNVIWYVTVTAWLDAQADPVYVLLANICPAPVAVLLKRPMFEMVDPAPVRNDWLVLKEP